ncbi:uncharacterized [Tachysurus ichikawai]
MLFCGILGPQCYTEAALGVHPGPGLFGSCLAGIPAVDFVMCRRALIAAMGKHFRAAPHLRHTHTLLARERGAVLSSLYTLYILPEACVYTLAALQEQWQSSSEVVVPELQKLQQSGLHCSLSGSFSF